MTSATRDSLLKIAILGASGYTGAELLRLLLRHPGVLVSAKSTHGSTVSRTEMPEPSS